MIEIKKIDDKRGLEQFIQFRNDLYKKDKWDVPYLHFDEMNTLRKDKNASFEDCEADYFLALKDGKAVGRVAAIINRKANEKWQRRGVRFGWFDFVDDLEVSRTLIQTVERWGRERGMTEIVGPMGFADTDREGMQVKGFETMATMYANHNYDYYPRHMEQMGGFRKDNDYVQMMVTVPEKMPEKITRVAQMIRTRYHLDIHKLTRKELMRDGKGHEIFRLLNQTYKDLYGFAELSDSKVDQLVEQYIKIADLNLVSTVVDNNIDGRIVGFGITFPSLSEAMRKTRNGRLLPMGWWHLLNAIYWHRADTVDMLLVGVLPEYRTKGANALILYDLVGWYQRYGFKQALAMPQMETNSKALGQWDYFESTESCRLRCYVKEMENS